MTMHLLLSRGASLMESNYCATGENIVIIFYNIIENTLIENGCSVDGYRRIKRHDMVYLPHSDNWHTIFWNPATRGSRILFHRECPDRIRRDPSDGERQPGKVCGDQETASGLEREAGISSTGTLTRS
jgi:hypothetical protein